MRESIRVKNFLVIKKADIEVKKINLIIGPQANGKSIIAKLLHFFKKLDEFFIDSVRKQESKRNLDKRILLAFEERFPKYAWDGSSFQIDYVINDFEFVIKGIKGARGKTSLRIQYSENLSRLFNNRKSLFQKKMLSEKSEPKTSRRPGDIEGQILFKYIIQPLVDKHPEFLSSSMFIPASRSFFANLQKNIFTFLASNLDIDPFLKEFGSIYESSKRWYKEPFINEKRKDILDELHRTTEAIIDGDYEYHDEQDWIVSKGKRINLVNASSGQQESLPMLLVLCIWPLIGRWPPGLNDAPQMFFIEEPEAHLFPTSQGHIVSVLSLLYRKANCNFFITSHSPYILSALNNFIIAGDAEESGKITIDEFRKMNGTGMPIKFDDVSAYTIKNGKTEVICDEEFRLIGGDILDEISDHFESVMTQLMERGATT